MCPVKQEVAKSNAVTVKQGKSKSIASFSSVKAGPCHDQVHINVKKMREEGRKYPELVI